MLLKRALLRHFDEAELLTAEQHFQRVVVANYTETDRFAALQTAHSIGIQPTVCNRPLQICWRINIPRQFR